VTVTEEATTDAPTDEPTEEPAGFSAKPEDFKIDVSIRRKECFGSAGCNVTYRIKPQYVGDQTLPDTGTIEVTYEVSGGEDGPAVNTFTIEGGTASYDREESLSTPSSSTKIKAKATDVTYDEG
jgi:hypothetical protein